MPEPRVSTKFLGTITAFGMLMAGLVLAHCMKISEGLYSTFSKWIIWGLGIYVGGNGAITISSLFRRGGTK
jgi:hypothetical protein